MQEDLSRNRFLLLTNKQAIVYQTLWSLNKGTKIKYVEVMFKPKWIYQRALISKQLINKKTDIKRKSRRQRVRREPLQPYEQHTKV